MKIVEKILLYATVALVWIVITPILMVALILATAGYLLILCLPALAFIGLVAGIIAVISLLT